MKIPKGSTHGGDNAHVRSRKAIFLVRRITEMTGDLKRNNNEDMGVICEGFGGSVYSMAAVACGILLCAGIIIYALIGA